MVGSAPQGGVGSGEETTATVRHTRALQRRRVIERPRLFTLLGDSTARVRMLVAPAGYGKTTLAEQWVARDGREGAWFTARRSSQDVAALALGIARTASRLVPGCDERLREHLRAVPAPEHVDTLAEILGEDLAAWPSHGWLVLDEYQEIVGAPEAEQFVGALVNASAVQLLVATRQRPSWVTTRALLYGDVLELSQTALAMDAAEAAEVLGDQARSASGLVALANGWPAVIGLASVSSANPEGGAEHVPESLYRFFAEEVFAALGEEVLDGLARLAVAPVLDRELVDLLLEVDADAVCRAALDVGILVDHADGLELHPLARSFLEERSAELGAEPDETLAPRCIAHYRGNRDWDAAFEVIARHGMVEALDALLQAALDELLDTARLSTIETWTGLATDLDLDSASVALARAEVALRRGRHAVAQAHAEVAALPGSPLEFRALAVAGRAAHLASHEEEALELYRRAEAAARNEGEQRDALWGQVMCLIELERPDALRTLSDLRSRTSLSRPRDAVRAAAYTLSAQLKFGALELAEVDVALDLLPAVEDPLVESAFRNVYSAALALSARYDDALEAAERLLATVDRYRLEFVVPYALSVLAVAHAGRRQWELANRALDRAVVVSREGRNYYAEQVCFAVRVRSLAQQGRHDAALNLTIPELRNALPAARSEVLASRALVLASASRLAEASALIDEIRGASRAIEPTVLIAAVDALVELKSRRKTGVDEVGRFFRTAVAAGAIDLLVVAYRANPDLLAVLLKHHNRNHFADVVRMVRDEDLAEAVGHAVRGGDDPRAKLTKREREVFGLLVQGLTNREIAKLLFIEESTTKLHAQHIYNKLGIHSRTALAVQAALERADQATRATGTDDSSGAS